jgi:hypothetical protein
MKLLESLLCIPPRHTSSHRQQGLRSSRKGYNCTQQVRTNTTIPRSQVSTRPLSFQEPIASTSCFIFSSSSSWKNRLTALYTDGTSWVTGMGSPFALWRSRYKNPSFSHAFRRADSSFASLCLIFVYEMVVKSADSGEGTSVVLVIVVVVDILGQLEEVHEFTEQRW